MASSGRKQRSASATEAETRIATALTEHATILDLSGLDLTALPEALGELAQLQQLDLSHNQLTALPEALGKLTSCNSSTSRAMSSRRSQFGFAIFPAWRHSIFTETRDLPYLKSYWDRRLVT
jgi:hypothetical protein